MAKPVLKDLVQDLLSDIDGDEINSISDTLESTQIATVIRDVFRNIADEYDLETIKESFQLTASGTSSRPTHMTVPESYHSIEFVKYDMATTIGGDQKFEDVCWLEPKDFVDYVNARTESASNITEITDPSSVLLLIRTDAGPQYWSTLDGGDTAIFDSYDSDIESTLQSSKTFCYGTKKPDITISDTATIDLPHSLMTLLRNESRAMVFELYKEGVTPKVEQFAKRSRARANRLRHITRLNREQDNRPDYGRRRRK